MSTTLIKELKEAGQDFEFYPTTKNMIELIYSDIEYRESASWLDIGAGTCNFKKFFKELEENDTRDNWSKPKLSQYYVIEKSQILVDKFDLDTLCIGRDFYTTTLLDKPVDFIFCNPPYSDYATWVADILTTSNVSQAIYMVIPSRWSENEQIQQAIEFAKVTPVVLGSSDFTHAERQARAKVDIVKFEKGYSRYASQKEYNNSAFDKFFDEFFTIKEEDLSEETKQNTIKNQIVSAESKAMMLQKLYDEERNRLLSSFQAICDLPYSTLQDIGVDKDKVKEALKLQMSGLKTRYWKVVFDTFSEITERLTTDTRELLMSKFKNIKTIDFCVENIYPVLVWVVKNANQYYDSQMLDWFKKLTSPENIKNYKSNKRCFETDTYRHQYFTNINEVTHYTLDYRIIMSTPFRTDWHGKIESDYKTKNTLNDIFIIAKNLGFTVNKDYETPSVYGKEYEIYLTNGKVFMKYRTYKNGNMHVKFNLEFMKALNVTCSRLLGWVRSAKEAQEEFDGEMGVDIEKYFNTNTNFQVTAQSMSQLLIGVNYGK